MAKLIKKKEEFTQIGKQKFSNLDKIFWPKEKYTKGDLINYYQKILPYILPYLKDRPESLHRFPDGITGGDFYQKNAANLKEKWLKKVNIPEESGEDVYYLIVNDEKSLLYLINLGCIDLNPWNSRVGLLQKPDYLVIDLDPEKTTFEKVIAATLDVKKILDRAGIKGYVKTSGMKGIHIYLPMGGKYTYQQVRHFAEVLVNFAHQENPKITSLERLPEKRQGKVYLDFLQNSEGQTVAAPYSVRPIAGANVSAPLLWKEVKKGLDPSQFNFKNIFSRIKKIGDPFKEVLGPGLNLKRALTRLER